MTKPLKFLIGLAAALAVGWVSHGPLGRGEAFLTQLEEPLQPLIANTRVAGVTVHMQRDPMARTAILSGPADCFQRNGLGSYGGIDARVLTIPGIRRVEWTNEAPNAPCR